MQQNEIKHCAIAGTGVRALGLARGIIEDNNDIGDVVALYDTNPKRMAGFVDLLGKDIPSFTDFDTLVKQTSVDTLIVCTPDHTHPDLIELAFEHGLEVICEKPLAMDLEGLQRSAQAERKYDKKIKVGFNMRYMPFAAKVKQVLSEIDIGPIYSGNVDWFIDKTHGVEYFRRWHAHLSNSGGLFVHKATHHFDLLNWWLDDKPVAVNAAGSLQVYGGAGPFRGENCRTCEYKNSCWAAMKSSTIDDKDLVRGSDEDIMRKLYFDAEKQDGYIRDKCVFDKSIDIYDTMNALIKYENGAQISYSLNAYAPYQGFRFSFTGVKGCVEIEQISQGTRLPGAPETDTIKIITGTNRQNIKSQKFDVPLAKGSHGGGDTRMIRNLLEGAKDDPLSQVAGSKAGIDSALIGICANESVRKNLWVELPKYG